MADALPYTPPFIPPTGPNILPTIEEQTEDYRAKKKKEERGIKQEERVIQKEERVLEKGRAKEDKARENDAKKSAKKRAKEKRKYERAYGIQDSEDEFIDEKPRRRSSEYRSSGRTTGTDVALCILSFIFAPLAVYLGTGNLEASVIMLLLGLLIPFLWICIPFVAIWMILTPDSAPRPRPAHRPRPRTDSYPYPPEDSYPYPPSGVVGGGKNQAPALPNRAPIPDKEATTAASDIPRSTTDEQKSNKTGDELADQHHHHHHHHHQPLTSSTNGEEASAKPMSRTMERTGAMEAEAEGDGRIDGKVNAIQWVFMPLAGRAPIL